MSQLKLTEDEWFDQFKPIPNKVPGGTNGECGLTIDNIGYKFETYGADMEFVREQPDENIWTMIEADGAGFISQGFHVVNSDGYFITEVAADPNVFYDIQLYEYDGEENNENALDNFDGDALASAGHGTDEDYSHETI
jgi:hypothetical protein